MSQTQATQPEIVLALKTDGDDKTFPKRGDVVEVHYRGRIARTNEFFDGSYGVGASSRKPYQFTVGQREVIAGWDAGVKQIPLGAKATLTVPYQYAYGERGAGTLIPPRADLLFDLELVSINGRRWKGSKKNLTSEI